MFNTLLYESTKVPTVQLLAQGGHGSPTLNPHPVSPRACRSKCLLASSARAVASARRGEVWCWWLHRSNRCPGGKVTSSAAIDSMLYSTKQYSTVPVCLASSCASPLLTTLTTTHSAPVIPASSCAASGALSYRTEGHSSALGPRHLCPSVASTATIHDT